MEERENQLIPWKITSFLSPTENCPSCQTNWILYPMNFFLFFSFLFWRDQSPPKVSYVVWGTGDVAGRLGNHWGWKWHTKILCPSHWDDLWVCLPVCMYVHTRVHARAHTCVCMPVCVHACVCTCMHVSYGKLGGETAWTEVIARNPKIYLQKYFLFSNCLDYVDSDYSGEVQWTIREWKIWFDGLDPLWEEDDVRR